MGAVVLALGAIALLPSVAAAARAHRAYICSGPTKKSAGVLAGNYRYGVVVKGFCAVNAGLARVTGTITLSPGSAMAAAFGLNHRTNHGGSRLIVTGNLVVGRGASLILGCKVLAGGNGSPCLDDPNMNKPTLTSAERVSGSLIENAPLAVIVHNSKIGANVQERGGGGGFNCKPSKLLQGSPLFSDYEDSTVGGNLGVSALTSCWLGVARVHVGGNLSFVNDRLADPDAIEILANHVGRNLSCLGNSSVWNSSEMSMSSTFPRQAEPNTVNGRRSGQCVLSTPTTQGGGSGPGPF